MQDTGIAESIVDGVFDSWVAKEAAARDLKAHGFVSTDAGESESETSRRGLVLRVAAGARYTDAEAILRRYPVRLLRISLVGAMLAPMDVQLPPAS